MRLMIGYTCDTLEFTRLPLRIAEGDLAGAAVDRTWPGPISG
ncbi:hypothetical protein [Microbispora oryzae]|nr:hypothetical protein [Microbispora oryzae]